MPSSEDSQPLTGTNNSGSTRLQLSMGMRASIVEGMFALMLAAFTCGSVMTGLALSLGASAVQIGLISGIPPLVNLLQVVSPLWIERLKSRKLYVAVFAGLNRALICLSVLTIFLPPSIRVFVFLSCLTVSFICSAMASVAWGTWMSEMVPEDIRGKYFAKRNAIINLTYAITAPLAGKLLDAFPQSTGIGGDNVQGSVGFFILYALGLICSLSNTASFFVQHEPPYHPTRQKPAKLFKTYLLAFRNRPFILTVTFFAIWTFARTIADPFYSVYMIQNLKIPYFQIKLFETTSFIVLIFSSFLWGYLVDKIGYKTIVRICSSLFTITPILWIFVFPGHYLMLWPMYVIAGFLGGGMNLATFNLFLSSSPRKNKSVYMALWTSIIGLMGFIGPSFGGWLIDWMKDYHLNVGHLVLCNIQIVFFLSGTLTLFASLIFPDIKESKKPITVPMAQIFRLLNPFVLFGLIYNLVIFNVTKEEDSKLKASKALGKLRSPLAVDELIEALNDPSPAVREQAAVSLGEIGDTHALDILINKLQSPEENIQEEAAEALGKIQHSRAVEPLLKRLNDPDPSLRASVILALGNIQDPRAKDLLFDRLQKETDSKIFPALVDSLAKIHDTRIVSIALARLDQFSSPVVRRQILDSVAYLVDDDDDFYAVSGLDAYEQDQWINRRLKSIRRTLSGRKSPFTESDIEQIDQIIKKTRTYFENEKYDPCVHQFQQLCQMIAGIMPSLQEADINHELITLDLNAIETIIKLNNSVNLDRDEVLFMIVTLDRIVTELVD